ncbi:MAG: hypothetical protein QX203_14485 [Methylococcaceae bacterium]
MKIESKFLALNELTDKNEIIERLNALKNQKAALSRAESRLIIDARRCFEEDVQIAEKNWI